MGHPVTLLYHAVAAVPPGAHPEERGMFVAPQVFAHQMELLANSGYRTLRLDEYAALLEGRLGARNRILLTFDDAYAHVDEAVTPILQRHGFTAVMFAPWAHLGTRNRWDEPTLPNLSRLQIMTREALRSLPQSVWEVASHASRHVDLRRLEREVRLRELREARDGLSELLEREVLDLAYPFGCHDAAVRMDAADTGHRLAFAANGDASGGPLQLPRRGIGNSDTGIVFRLKAGRVATWLYRAKGLARRFREEPVYSTDVPVA